jgi:hypothetical protein
MDRISEPVQAPLHPAIGHTNRRRRLCDRDRQRGGHPHPNHLLAAGGWNKKAAIRRLVWLAIIHTQ